MTDEQSTNQVYNANVDGCWYWVSFTMYQLILLLAGGVKYLQNNCVGIGCEVSPTQQCLVQSYECGSKASLWIVVYDIQFLPHKLREDMYVRFQNENMESKLKLYKVFLIMS